MPMCLHLGKAGHGTATDPACRAFPLARTFDEVMEALAALYTEDHDFGQSSSTWSTGWSHCLAESVPGERLEARPESRATARAMSRRLISGASTSKA